MDHGDGPFQITAGPGVGKTYALTLRVSFLLCVQEVSPEAIVLTTFTRKAAAELRYRLQEILSCVNSLIVWEEIRTLRGMSRAKVHRERDRASHGMCENPPIQ